MQSINSSDLSNSPASSTLTGKSYTPPSRTGVIVIVDDEMMVTSSLKTMLLLQTDHSVHCFNDPQIALAEIPKIKPDVVLSDFSMPGINGIMLLKEVRKLLPEATLMLLTGYADKESAIDAINTVGIYRYLEKPWDNDDLKLSINNGLERSRLIGDLKHHVSELDAAHRELERANHHLEELVTERTRDLQAAYRTLSSIVNNATDGIITLDADLRIQSCNPAAERWIRHDGGLPFSESILNQPVEKLLNIPVGNQDRIASSKSVRDLFHSDKACRIDELLIGQLPVEASVAPISDGVTTIPQNGDGKLSNQQRTPGTNGFVLVLRDISARREVERMRDDFVSTLTHDLRTPLLAAIQTLGFFMDGEMGLAALSHQEELVPMLIASHKDMLELVNVLLDVYRYEAGNQPLIFDHINVPELLGMTGLELEALALSRNQSLTVEQPNGETDMHKPSFQIRGDKRELKRVFTNLMGNAIHYTPRGGEIRVVSRLIPTLSNTQPVFNGSTPTCDESCAMSEHNKQGAIQIVIIDNGRGIPARDLPALFQRFSQGTSRQRSSGSGLGLYLSRQIVEAHNGHIWVESEEGVGSRFYVELPLI